MAEIPKGGEGDGIRAEGCYGGGTGSPLSPPFLNHQGQPITNTSMQGQRTLARLGPNDLPKRKRNGPKRNHAQEN